MMIPFFGFCGMNSDTASSHLCSLAPSVSSISRVASGGDLTGKSKARDLRPSGTEVPDDAGVLAGESKARGLRPSGTEVPDDAGVLTGEGKTRGLRPPGTEVPDDARGSQ
jgi:hypothetical protein